MNDVGEDEDLQDHLTCNIIVSSRFYQNIMFIHHSLLLKRGDISLLSCPSST